MDGRINLFNIIDVPVVIAVIAVGVVVLVVVGFVVWGFIKELRKK